MNETLKVLESRRFCRNFKPDMISKEDLDAILRIWIHRAKEEFESDFGKNILKKLGIEGEYEGIGHCALGYAAEPVKPAAERKENYVYYI